MHDLMCFAIFGVICSWMCDLRQYNEVTRIRVKIMSLLFNRIEQCCAAHIVTLINQPFCTL
jgi:hypothetical protein